MDLVPPRLQWIRRQLLCGQVRGLCLMRTFQGQDPKRVPSCKSRPPRKRLCKLSENDEVYIIDDKGDSGKDCLVEDTGRPLFFKKPKFGYGTVLPSSISTYTYTVQCADCYKWRVVPRKEKYEELRESICEELFVCGRAHEWHRVLSCDDPEDMSPDGSRVWAIDKPNIVQPPPGWDREVRLRGASTKFADVYYTSPSGKTLRSSVEIGRYLADNPQYIAQGVNLSQFSFATPKPVDEVDVKRSISEEGQGLPELAKVDQLCLAAPPTHRELLGEPGCLSSDHADHHQPEVPGHSYLDQCGLSESSAPLPKKRNVKQVSSRMRPRTLPAATCSFEDQSGGNSE
ncbi:hypothetical protein EJB05_26976, partial [Eragrostis curvula]